ncbi:MAG: trehalose-phosphatase [Solirubrobacterales bacterium]
MSAKIPAGPPPALAPLLAEPLRSALLTDVDGTLAPIAERPEQARVPEAATRALRELSRRFGLVGCVSGRRAVEAREMVGLPELAYAGNHGLELLAPWQEEPSPDPSISGRETAARDFVAGLEARLADSGVRVEDKGPIQALHWRGAADEAAAEQVAREVAERAGGGGGRTGEVAERAGGEGGRTGEVAERAGGEVGWQAGAELEARWGRKVLELRPRGGGGKDAAVAALIGAGEGIVHAAYAGDDRTDLDAFRGLRGLRAAGRLETAVCIGVVSTEGPAEISEQADLTVEDPSGWLRLLLVMAEL